MHPVLFQLGSVTIYSYGVAVAAAVAIAVATATYWAPKAGRSSTVALDTLFVLFVSGIVGARIWYVLQHWSEFSGDPGSIVFLQQGGLVWYGGFLLGLSCAFVYLRMKREPFLVWADLLAPLAALAHGIGRLGCFFNGCCFGDLMGVPTQMAEFMALAVLAVLLRFLWHRRRFDGQILCVYGLFYSLIRFGIEFFRQDQSRLHGLSIAQWTSVAIFVTSFVAYQILGKIGRKVSVV